MDKLITVLESRGPLTGKDLVIDTGIDTFTAWKKCNRDKQIITRIIGKRYLRLDLKVAGYARLSPSIMREFLNYTIIGLDNQNNAIATIANQLEKTIAAISTRKIELARETITRLLESHPDRAIINDRVCFIIAGDVVFNMAHAESRPEISTGELVRGSDLDIIVVNAGLPEKLLQSLDNLIYQEKHNLLMNPALKEEIDYIIKNLATVEEQLKFGDFKAMVASKILNEGQFLFGNSDLYSQIRQLLIRNDIPEKIRLLEIKARQNRIDAENRLILAGEKEDLNELMPLFYTTEEKEEIF
jgi:hypothetical protein